MPAPFHAAPTARDAGAQRVLICGYWGFGNVGDEAVVATVIDDIRAIWPDSIITLTSERPAHTSAMHNVEAVNWRKISAWRPALEAADHVIIGGGGLWNSYFPFESDTLFEDTDNYALHIYSAPILARLFDKPVTIYGVGGGVIHGKFAQRLAQTGLESASTIVVRDQRTARFFAHDLSISTPLTVSADPAFRLGEPAQTLAALNEIRTWASANRPIVAIIRHWLDVDRDAHARTLAITLRDASRQTGRPILFIAFDRDLHDGQYLSDDAMLIHSVAKYLDDVPHRMLLEEYHPSQLAAILRDAACVFSMRLHGCILGVRAHAPVLAVSYDEKVRAVMADIGLGGQVIEMDDLKTGEALARLCELTASADARANASRAHDAALHSAMAAPHALVNALTEARCAPENAILLTLRRDLLAKGLDLMSLAQQSMIALTAQARSMVNGGDSAAAMPLLEMLRIAFPKNGEWPYLTAITLAQRDERGEKALHLLDEAEKFGFDPDWVDYARICELAVLGDQALVRRILARMQARSSDHPALAAAIALMKTD